MKSFQLTPNSHSQIFICQLFKKKTSKVSQKIGNTKRFVSNINLLMELFQLQQNRQFITIQERTLHRLSTLIPNPTVHDCTGLYLKRTHILYKCLQKIHLNLQNKIYDILTRLDRIQMWIDNIFFNIKIINTHLPLLSS